MKRLGKTKICERWCTNDIFIERNVQDLTVLSVSVNVYEQEAELSLG